MNMEEPLVSISCITYNHEPFIRQCLDGLMMQKTDFLFEILIHDDASTDGTVSIIQEYESIYPNIIKPIYEEENQWIKGRRGSCVFNFPRAKGKYIALCEGDDYWTDPLKLQKQVDFLETHEDVSMCFHNVKIINPEGNRTGDFRRYNKDQYVPVEDMLKSRGDFCPTASFVFRTQYIKSGYPDFCMNCFVGDWSLQLYLSYKGKIYYFDKEMSVYRFGEAGAWTRTFRKSEFSPKKIKQLMSGLEMTDGINALFNYKYSSSIVKGQASFLFVNILLPNRDRKREIKEIFKPWISKMLPRDKFRFFLIYHFYFLYCILSKLSSYRHSMLRRIK